MYLKKTITNLSKFPARKFFANWRSVLHVLLERDDTVRDNPPPLSPHSPKRITDAQ